MGYLELGFSIGLAIGPIGASIFYSLGGYSLPFFAFGAIMFICIPALSTIEITEASSEEEQPNFLYVMLDKVTQNVKT